jgi:hypothetical protein
MNTNIYITKERADLPHIPIQSGDLGYLNLRFGGWKYHLKNHLEF